MEKIVRINNVSSFIKICKRTLWRKRGFADVLIASEYLTVERGLYTEAEIDDP